MDRNDPAYRGQSDYSPALLRLYDPLELGPIARFVWRSPVNEHISYYPMNIRPNHLDVGPGTGYFLEHAGLPDGSMVLHCLPGPMERKALAIENIARVMAPDGVLFGGTVLGRSARHTRLGRAILWAFNRRGAIGNLDDTEAGLRDILGRSFKNVEVKTYGGIATFVATEPASVRN
jgi:hypothetical protein